MAEKTHPITVKFEISVTVDHPSDLGVIADKIDLALCQYVAWSRWVNGPYGEDEQHASGSRRFDTADVSWRLIQGVHLNG